MTRLASILIALLLLAVPAWACDPPSNNPINTADGSHVYSVTTSTAIGLSAGAYQYPSHATAATVAVTAADIAVLINNQDPTSTTGIPFGQTSPNTMYFEVCGKASLAAFRMIATGGTATVKVIFFTQ